MFPVKLCGLWTLISCRNAEWLGSELEVNYNAVRVATVKRYGFLSVKKTHYGSVFLSDDANAKLAWSPNVDWVVETPVLPRIALPVSGGSRCRRMALGFSLDDSQAFLTVMRADSADYFVFRKNVEVPKNEDTIAKLFLTQLIFDGLIRHLHHFLFQAH